MWPPCCCFVLYVRFKRILCFVFTMDDRGWHWGFTSWKCLFYLESQFGNETIHSLIWRIQWDHSFQSTISLDIYRRWQCVNRWTIFPNGKTRFSSEKHFHTVWNTVQNCCLLKFYKSLNSLVSIPPLPARWKAIFEGLGFYDKSNYCNADRVLIPFGCNKYYNQVVEGLRNFHLPSQCNGFVQGK